MIETLKKEEIRLADWEYQYQQRGEQPISLCDFFCRSVSRYLISILSGKGESCSYLFTDSSKGYDNCRETERICELLQEQVRDQKSLRTILRNSIVIPKQFNTVADKVTEAITDPSISNEHLAKFWKEMDESFLRVIPWFFYPWYISKENYLTDRVEKGLLRHQAAIETVCDMDEALLVLIFPVKKTAFQLEQDDLFTLVLKAGQKEGFSEDPDFKQQAAAYLKKYDWLTTFILTPLLPMTYEQLVERVKRARAESFEETYILQKEASQKKEARAKQLMTLLADDTELIQEIRDARELGYVLTAGIEEAYQSSARYLGFMQLVAERIGVEFVDMKYLLSDEVQSALTNNRPISEDTITERKRGFVMMTMNGQEKAAFGDVGHAISVWIDTELNRVDTTVTSFKGMTACKGWARGRVRVAITPQVAHLLTEGEILVTPMTNPDYVPAMRRAAAIVTDEGGLLSHAAIMSREFGKPCIIATKVATQVLHDGDLVEVDAEQGLVRILERGPEASRGTDNGVVRKIESGV